MSLSCRDDEIWVFGQKNTNLNLFSLEIISENPNEPWETHPKQKQTYNYPKTKTQMT